MCIVDSRDQVLRLKTVRLVKVLWRHYGVEEYTWERKDTMRVDPRFSRTRPHSIGETRFFFFFFEKPFKKNGLESPLIFVLF